MPLLTVLDTGCQLRCSGTAVEFAAPPCSVPRLDAALRLGISGLYCFAQQPEFAVDALILSRFQFGANISFHILFPAITIGLGWMLLFFKLHYRLTIWQAASAPESLAIILVGTVVVLPIIIFYSFYAYRVFGGKATDLTYD
jgi:cytochrome bd-type quinol oxidase subunit 2